MAGLDQYAMLDLIAAGARLARPHAPETVTTRAFDAATAEDERFADLPRARSLCRIFLQGWPDLVELALRSGQDRARELARRTDTQEAGWFSHEQAEFALRLVCRRLGGLASFDPADYRRERDALIQSAGRGSAIAPLALPTQNQIVALFGDWDSALAAAGLVSRDSSAITGSRAASAANAARLTPTIIEVLDRCYEAHGTQPTFNELALFAKANGIPFPRKEVGRPWSDFLDEWKDGRRAQGLVVPDGPPPKRDRPDYGQDVGAARDNETRLTKWNDELILEWVVRFLDQLPRDRRPTLRVYADWTATTPGSPAGSILHQHGGFSHFMDRARERRGSRRQVASR